MKLRPAMWRETQGLSYVEFLLSVATLLVIVTSLGGGLTHGVQLSRVTKARTEVLNAAQAEMEKIRGIPFDRIMSYTVNGPSAVGEVSVEQVTARRKRIFVLLQHPQYRNQRVELVTYVHRNGLNL